MAHRCQDGHRHKFHIHNNYTMEAVENAVDYYLTGGTGFLNDPAFWIAIGLSMIAGFPVPLSYNYIQLRKYGKACH